MASANTTRLPRALRPFRTGQYRILAAALVLSLFGAGVWLVAMVFQVRELGGGPIQLSYVATANSVGLIVAVLFGGAIADRIPQKRILLAVEATKAAVIIATAALALSGALELWMLVIAALVLGLADGFFYPAYSALLPSILHADELLAANGVEGMLRPTIMQALGPLVAGIVIAVLAPSAAFAIIGVTQLLAVAGLAWLRTTPVRRDVDESAAPRHPVVAMFIDIREGVGFVVKTPWLLWTLLFALLMVLAMMGPIEVLLPFAVTDQAGGDAGSFALVLAAFGAGGAISSILVASRKLPRRYLTVMTLGWGAGAIPLTIIGLTDQVWVMAVAVFVVGFGFGFGQVIWGTLLQRRVPPAMLGRVSSLDFFVSLAFMPISMAVAGPVGEAIGFGPTFLIAGLVPIVLAVLVIAIARMPRDEIANPLDVTVEQTASA
ncbi:tetracycline efflux MFS transporter Tet(V) [soil metagenome]